MVVGWPRSDVLPSDMAFYSHAVVPGRLTSCGLDLDR